MMSVVILAAGFGSRLGRPLPKPLTVLGDGRSILRTQVDSVRQVLGDETVLVVVVGFKFEMIMEAFPDVLFAYNEFFDRTNTSKSLHKGLSLAPPGGTLWLNGDVVFEPALLERLAPRLVEGSSLVCVDQRPVGDEEVTYLLDDDGAILRLGKGLAGGRGEAVGVNYVAEHDRGVLLSGLAQCGDDEYFEAGVERAIAGGASFAAFDVGEQRVIEIDYEEDLRRANDEVVKRWAR